MNREIWLDNLRIFATYCVVLIHVSGHKDPISLFFSSFARCSVPLFILISGSLQLSYSNFNTIDFYKKRIPKTIAILLFWGCIYILFNHVFHAHYNIKGFIGSFILSVTPGSFHLWFLYLILGLYLVTPLLYKIQKTLSSKDLLILSFFLAVIFLDFPLLKILGFEKISLIHIDLYPPYLTLFIPYIPYYIAGKAIKDLNIKLNKFQIFVLMLGILGIFSYTLSLVFIRDDSSFVSYISFDSFVLSLSIFLLFFQFKCPIFSRSITRSITINCLGIYLIHNLVRNTLALFSISAYTLVPPIFLPIYAVVIMSISYGITALMQRYPLTKFFV
jgi:surface polysaccharide O-acyltransferase-like enzyme